MTLLALICAPLLLLSPPSVVSSNGQYVTFGPSPLSRNADKLVTLRWLSETGRTYRVESHAPDADAAWPFLCVYSRLHQREWGSEMLPYLYLGRDWDVVSGDMAGTGALLEWRGFGSGPARFFRVREW